MRVLRELHNGSYSEPPRQKRWKLVDRHGNVWVSDIKSRAEAENMILTGVVPDEDPLDCPDEMEA